MYVKQILDDSAVSYILLPYSVSQEIIINQYMLSALTWGLPHKRRLLSFCCGLELKFSGYSISVPRSLPSEISPKIPK